MDLKSGDIFCVKKGCSIETVSVIDHFLTQIPLRVKVQVLKNTVFDLSAFHRHLVCSIGIPASKLVLSLASSNKIRLFHICPRAALLCITNG